MDASRGVSLSLATCAALLLAVLASSGRAAAQAEGSGQSAVEGSGGADPLAPTAPQSAGLTAIDAQTTGARVSGCPAVRFASLLQCTARDLCQTDAQCGGAMLCCPGACGRRCRCPRAVCGAGCGAGSRCVWRRRCARRGRCSASAECVPAPVAAVCTPPCTGALACRRRHWSLPDGVCAPIDLSDLFEDAYKHDERDDCYENDDDDDDLFDDDLFEAGVRFRPVQRTGSAAPAATPAVQPAVSNNRGVFVAFARRPVAPLWPGTVFRYYDDDDDDDDDDDRFDYDDLFDFDK